MTRMTLQRLRKIGHFSGKKHHFQPCFNRRIPDSDCCIKLVLSNGAIGIST